MTKIVIIGAGLGGVPMAYELREELGREHELFLVSDSPDFQFVPSNPWVAVNWRKKQDITVPLAPYLARKNIGFSSAGVARILPDDNRIELGDGQTLDYEYLVLATGPTVVRFRPSLALTAHELSDGLNRLKDSLEHVRKSRRTPAPAPGTK